MDFGLKPIFCIFFFWQYQDMSFQQIWDRPFPGQVTEKMALWNLLLHYVF